MTLDKKNTKKIAYRPALLVILDGWGISSNTQGNVLKSATLPTIDKLNKFYPMTTLQASGISVGLPWGESGNSEVGHITLGSGKIIYQNLPRITLSIQDGSFYRNEAFLNAMGAVKEKGAALHLLGLFGDGAVHSYYEHVYALLDMAKTQKVEKVFIHIYTDGRDSAPTGATKKVKELQDKLNFLKIGKIASLCGRNWGMDRNNNWDRIEKSYNLLVNGTGEKTEDPIKYLQDSYAKEITDEYIEPAVICENGKPIGNINDGDSVIFFNFREDRAREITKAFVLPSFNKFPREKMLKINFVTMTEYEKDLPSVVAFPPENVKNGLGEIISKQNLKQLRIAETEKYAHVTYFFNGGKEEPWTGEDRLLVPSPSVSKFDQSPEMSAAKITEKVLEAVEKEKYDFILINYANADMVAHTGNESASKAAVEAVDKSLSFLVPAVLKKGGCLFITADHGNVEEIKNFHTGENDTEHSSNPVPFWYINPSNHRDKTGEEIVREQSEVGGLLSDVAPTILDSLELEIPDEMNGESLLPLLK